MYMHQQRANVPLQGIAEVHWQWEPYQAPTAKLEASYGAISLVVDLHGQK